MPEAIMERGETILIVEDSPDVAEAVAEVLRDEGYHVVVSLDAADALEQMAAARPLVAILDVGLPGTNGYELAAAARELLGAATPRLIALTGYSGPADRDRSERAGFAAHLVKPPSLDALLEAVDPAR